MRGLWQIFFILVALGVGYLLGFTHAQRAAGASSTEGSSLAAQNVVESGESATGTGAGEPAAGSEFEELLAGQRWYQLDAWFASIENPADIVESRHGRLLVRSIREHMNKYDAISMRQVLRSYLQFNPSDFTALQMLADLQQLEGMPEAALQTLLGVLQNATDANILQQAQTDAQRLIDFMSTNLEQRRAWSELAEFWEDVVRQMPHNDRYRLAWARALLQANQAQSAAAVLAEIGTAQIPAETLEELAADIAEAATGPGFVRRGSQWVARVSGQGSQGELLVDTGASITSFSRQLLDSLGARATGRRVQVRTASGLVETEVFVVPQVQIQNRQLQDLVVLKLPAELPGMQGLLGTDVLLKFGWSVAD